MQPRTLDSILGELNSTYDPQIKSIQARQAAIPGQVQAEEQGLQAKQENAFGDIVNGARRRGLGFSGIPLSEQARYTSTEFLPALARLRQSGREQAMSLEDALNGVYERRNTLGNQIYQNEQSAAEQRRQFDTNLAFQREQQAAQQRAQSLANAPLNPQGAGPRQQPQQNPALAKNLAGGRSLQDATSALQQLLSTNNTGVIRNTIGAIQQSASRGNTYDQAKLQIINSRPEFRQFLANSNGARF